MNIRQEIEEVLRKAIWSHRHSSTPIVAWVVTELTDQLLTLFHSYTEERERIARINEYDERMAKLNGEPKDE